MDLNFSPNNGRVTDHVVCGHSPWQRDFNRFLVVVLLSAASACADEASLYDATGDTMLDLRVRQPMHDLGATPPGFGGNADSGGNAGLGGSAGFGGNFDPNMGGEPDDAAMNAALDAGAEDAMGPMDPPPEPAGTRYVEISTTESLSWVAWHEVRIFAEGRNIALGAAVDASSATGNDPAGHANDDDLDTSWNSGDFPPASIVFDLGRTHEIEEVRLLVGQNPPSQTIHHLRFAGEDRDFEVVHSWRQATEAGDWLAWRDPGPGMDDPPDLPDGQGRGLRWVRTNPMFISGLTVQMPSPSAEDVRRYFDDFEATAVHLWGTGLPHRMNGWREASPRPPRFVSWVEDDGRSRDGHQLIGGYGANEPGRIGYQVGDEPLDMEEFLPIEEGLRAIREIDPEALLIVNFSFWAEGLDAILDRYATMDADVVSFDTYSMGREVYGRMGIFRAAALEMGRPYWCYLGSYGDHERAQFPHPTGMRWAAMAHATYGYTGYTWFLYQVDPAHRLLTAIFEQSGVFDSAQTPLFEVAAQLNRELRVLGRALTQLTSTGVRYVPALLETVGILAQPPGTENWARGAGGDGYLVAVETDGLAQDVVLGFFADDDGGRYFMVQNPNHVRGTFPTDSTNDAQIRLRFDFSSRDEGPPDHLQWLNARSGAVERQALAAEGGDGAGLSLTLPAGDARLFKYPSNQPFALGPR